MMVFQDNQGGIYDDNVLLHDKRWYVYMSENISLFKDGHSVEVSGSDGERLFGSVR